MTAVEKLFVGFAIVGGALFCARLILFFVGGFGDADGDADGGLADSDVSFTVLTFQGVTAFFMMFGLTGLALSKEFNVRAATAIGGGMLVGVFAVWLIAKVMSMMRGLQSSGTIEMKNAIGEKGSIYLTIPPGGTGKARVTVQGRLLVLNALAKSGEEIKTGAQIEVVEITGDNVLVVEKL